MSKIEIATVHAWTHRGLLDGLDRDVFEPRLSDARVERGDRHLLPAWTGENNIHENAWIGLNQRSQRENQRIS